MRSPLRYVFEELTLLITTKLSFSKICCNVQCIKFMRKYNVNTILKPRRHRYLEPVKLSGLTKILDEFGNFQLILSGSSSQRQG